MLPGGVVRARLGCVEVAEGDVDAPEQRWTLWARRPGAGRQQRGVGVLRPLQRAQRQAAEPGEVGKAVPTTALDVRGGGEQPVGDPERALRIATGERELGARIPH